MNPNGRPRVLDDVAKQAQVLQAVADGLSERAAANSVGIGIRTLQRFTRERPKFRARLRKAKARHEAELVACIRDASGTNPRIAAWKLERANPKAYQLRQPHPLSLDDAFHIVSSLFKAACEYIVGDRLRHGFSRDAHRLIDSLKPGLARHFKQGLQPPSWLAPLHPPAKPDQHANPPILKPISPTNSLTPPPVQTSDPPSSNPPGSDPPASEAPSSEPPSSDPLTSDAPSSDVSSSVQ